MKISTLTRGITAAAALALIAAAPASAQVTGVFGSGSEGDNLLFNNGDTNQFNPIDAVLNGDPSYHVKVDSSTDGLTAQGSGQASVQPDDNLLNSLSICATPGNVFWQVIANAETGDDTLSFSTTGTYGSTPSQDIGQLGNGQNFFTIRATNPGDGIYCLTINSTNGFKDLKQIRLASGPAPVEQSVITPPTQDVPEPGTYAMLAGMGVMGVGFLQRRARK